MSEQSEATEATKTTKAPRATRDTEATEAAKTAKSPQYSQGDEITVMRGLDRGKTAKVMGVDEKNEQYAVQFADGAFSVVNFVNVKAPQEGTVTVTTLVDAFTEAIQSGERDILQLAARLDATLPGFSTKLPA